jgi:hypothetical protein
VGQLHPPWDAQVVEGVADVLRDTTTGLTASQIGQMLGELTISDPLGAGHQTSSAPLRTAVQAAEQPRVQLCDRRHHLVDGSSALRNEPSLRTPRQDALNDVLV